MERLKIFKTDVEVVSKFREDNRNFKVYHLSDGLFYLWATKPNSRYYHPVREFRTLHEAEKFIYTADAFDMMP